jgi:hypothetical protein
MQGKLLGNVSVEFDATGKLLFIQGLAEKADDY